MPSTDAVSCASSRPERVANEVELALAAASGSSPGLVRGPAAACGIGVARAVALPALAPDELVFCTLKLVEARAPLVCLAPFAVESAGGAVEEVYTWLSMPAFALAIALELPRKLALP